MSEFEHPTLPGFSPREVLEGLSPDQIVDTILADGAEIQKIEKRMDLAAEVLEGAYGLTVAEVLGRREREQNGEQS